jgi:hypothetical protein
MPDAWDASVYRQRASAWRERAVELTENDPQAAASCISIAEGYEKLAALLELRSQLIPPAKEA